jgi:hypothetical protein
VPVTHILPAGAPALLSGSESGVTVSLPRISQIIPQFQYNREVKPVLTFSSRNDTNPKISRISEPMRPTTKPLFMRSWLKFLDDLYVVVIKYER